MTTRNLICPICGEVLSVSTNEQGGVPGDFLLPRHVPRIGYGNLCAAYRITICINNSKCEKCGRVMSDHPSGMCVSCFSLCDEEKRK